MKMFYLNLNLDVVVINVGIRICNHLPTSIKSIVNETRELKKTLKRFLLDNSFYSVDDFFNYKE